MSDYVVAVFLNHLMQFGNILRLDPQDLNQLNLAFTLDTFLKQLELLLASSKYWKEHFTLSLFYDILSPCPVSLE